MPCNTGKIAQIKPITWITIQEIYAPRCWVTAVIAWSQNETMIMKLARLVSLDHVDTFPKGTITLPAAGATFGLPLADIIDVDAEKTRIEKSLQKLAKEIGGMQGRLNNPKFVASAPADVIEETRANLAEKLDEQSQFQAALDRLNELG